MVSQGWMQLIPDLPSVSPLPLHQGSYMGSQRLHLFSEHHQQGGHATPVPPCHKALCAYNVGAVLICCPIWVYGPYHTRTHTPFAWASVAVSAPLWSTCPSHPLGCMREVEAYPSQQLLPPNIKSETGMVWAGWGVLSKIYYQSNPREEERTEHSKPKYLHSIYISKT